MLLGARQFFERRGTPTPSVPTARDYVQNGLIAMWDGIENAGWGVHDGNLRARNLVGSGDMAFDPRCVIGEKSISFETRVNEPATTGDDGWGGLTDPVVNLPTDGPTLITYEYVGNLPQSGGWSHKAYPLLFRGARIVANNRQLYVLQRRRTGSAYGNYVFVTETADVHSASVGADTHIDGVLSDLGTVGSSGLLSITNDDAKVRIMGGVSESMTYQFVFCSLRIYSRALTAAEIAANYAIDKARFNLP